MRYKTKGTCSQLIEFDLDGSTVHNVRFTGGCPGNLAAISKLVEGAQAQSIADLLKGNPCGGRGTSCGDQLSYAIREALEKAA